MDVRITRTGQVNYYDAYRDGHDTTQIVDLSGTSSVSSNKLLISNCDLVTQIAVNNAQVEIYISVPVAPTAGQSKVWGLKAPAKGNMGAMVFDITDAVFSAKVYTADGTTTLFSYAIDWSTDWTATATRYRIVATERLVQFLIEDVIVATFDSDAGADGHRDFNNFAHNALPVRITNGNADNLFLSAISIY